MSGSDKVVPPKKSKAARKTDLSDETPGAESTEVQEQNGHADDPGKGSDAASGSGQDQEAPVNIFQQQIVEGKRKRNAPLAEQTLQDWLKKNFVEKENAFLLLNDMYQSYLEACSSVAAFAMDYTNFHKAVTLMFPKGQALVEDSPYKDTIREKKPKKKSTTKIQADSLHLKMKDIIKEAITDLGNPRKGIGFSAIKNLVAGKFPALRVDLRVNILKNAIFRELRFGHIECVRGIGACGYYRLPRTPEQDAEELEAEKKEAQEKALKKKGKKDATSPEEEGKTDENAEKTGAEPAEDAEKKDEEKPAEGTEEAASKEKKKKKKTKKRKKPQKDYYVAHSEPQHIEDTFALAMTYNSEPKEASVAKIRKYIKDFYKDDISIDKLKKCLDTGVENGFWFQVTGHGSGSGSFRLTINEFDPLADDDLTGKVMNAIVACTEPKQSSALLLKKYVQDYHPNFRVAERPHLFKMSLQRAVNKNMIVQLSGIGASGSFQLVDPFLPSPTVLQGKDTASDNGESDVEVIEDVEAFQDAYKPRPTKRRGMGRSATAVRRLDPSAAASAPPQTGTRVAKGRGAKKTVTGRGGRNAGKRNASSSEEESEEEESEEELPKKAPAKRKALATPSSAAGKAKKAKVVASSAKKPTGRRAAPVAASGRNRAASESESEEYDSEPEAYTPRRSTSRGGSGAPSAAAGRTGRGGKAKAPSPVRRTPASAKGGKKGGKEQSEEESEDSEVEKPQASPPRKGKPARKGKGGRKGKKPKTPVKKTPARGKAKEQSESEDEEPAARLPVTPKSATQSGRRPGSAARMRAQPPSEDDDEKKESGSAKLTKSSGLKVTVVLAGKRGSAGSKQVHKVTHVSPAVRAKVSEDEEEEDEKPEPAKKPKFGKSAAAGKKKKKGGRKAK